VFAHFTYFALLERHLTFVEILLVQEGAMPWSLSLQCSDTLSRSEDSVCGGHMSSFIIYSDSYTHIFGHALNGIPVSLQRMTSQLTVFKIALFYLCDAFGKVCNQ
jgi:hypothetical protein